MRLISVKDLGSVRFECSKCKAGAVSCAVTGWRAVPMRCPNCGDPWFVSDAEVAFQKIDRFRKALSELLAETSSGPSLKFELDAE